MSWNQLPPDTRQQIERILEPKQLEAWQLQLQGLGTRRIALQLDISRGAVIDRLDNAYRKLRQHGIHQDASGNWHPPAKDDAA